MGKIIQFKNKPQPLSYGQYYYENDNNTMESVEESDGVRKPYDKFSKQTLQTTIVTDEGRDLIIDEKFKFIGVSNIKINNLTIKNAGVNHKVKNTLFRGFIFDKNTFDCFKSNGGLKSYDEIHNALYYNTEVPTNSIEHPFGDSFPRIPITEGGQLGLAGNTRLYDHAMFFNWDAPRYGKRKGPGVLDFLSDQIIIENFNAANEAKDIIEVPELKHPGTLAQGMSNYTTDSWNNVNTTHYNQPFNPKDGFGEDDIAERITSVFSEDGQNNYLQFVIWTKGDARRTVGTKRRRKRLYVFKVNIQDLFDFSNDRAEGRTNLINFNDFKSVSGGGGSTPAFVVSNFSITINTFAGSSIEDYETHITNDSYKRNILESVVTPSPIRINSFDEDFIDVGIFTQPRYYSENLLNTNSRYGYNFTPTALVTIKDKLNQNLQAYKINDLDRQICSAPSIVELKINITDLLSEDSILRKKYPHENNIPPYYKFCVVDWNDVDNKIITVKDALDLKPVNLDEITKKQNDNTFIFEDIDNSLSNSYSTPGIKQIKVLIFNYNEYGNVDFLTDYSNVPSDNKNFLQIEPLRYKLMTIRIFLDIPVNQFPDFGEVGGSDYKTIPWPYTTPIINGTDNNSKYNKSIDNVLAGGKIGDTDIIDEIFLYQARENNELGKSIEKMDLEQCRYFNTGYSMYDLLGINAVIDNELIQYNNSYYDGDINKFPMESSVGQIFISDNQDMDLKESCKLELNTGELTGKSIYDSSGNSNKGLLIGDYRIKKIRKGEPMTRDSFIKVPKKTVKKDGAL